MLSQEQLTRLQNAGYKVIGNHSAVKLCLWCKKSIKTNGKDFCYKQKFYDINSHRCIQMTPALQFCNLKCLHCWRFLSTMKWVSVTKTCWTVKS